MFFYPLLKASSKPNVASEAIWILVNSQFLFFSFKWHYFQGYTRARIFRILEFFSKTAYCLLKLVFPLNLYMVPEIIFKLFAYWSSYCNFHAFNVKALTHVVYLTVSKHQQHILHISTASFYLKIWKPPSFLCRKTEAGSPACALCLNWGRMHFPCFLEDNCYFHHKEEKRF